MKTLTKIFATLAVVLLIASCERHVPNDPSERGHERDIFYTVSETPGMPSFSGTTTHLNNEEEWDQLLDHFCDMAKEGDQVSFCNTKPATDSYNAKGKEGGTSTSNTISTQSREELKAWMKTMEKAGKTVNVTYDKDSGRWNGTAYVNLNTQDVEAEDMTCIGSLILTQIPAIEDPITGSVWAIRANDETTYILTVQGMMLMSLDNEYPSLLEDIEVTLSGKASKHKDSNGNEYFSLDLNVDGEIIFG